MEWRRTHRLWAVQLKDAPSFDEFMGKRPVLSKEDKAERLWEQVEEERRTGVHVISECGEQCQHLKLNSSS